MSQDEVLSRFGRPSRINPSDGKWFYEMERQDEGHYRGVGFTFAEDYVVDVNCYGPP